MEIFPSLPNGTGSNWCLLPNKTRSVLTLKTAALSPAHPKLITPEVDSLEGFVYHLGEEQFEGERRITQDTRKMDPTIRRIYHTSGSNWCPLHKFRR